jgi:hypothetical protein
MSIAKIEFPRSETAKKKEIIIIIKFTENVRNCKLHRPWFFISFGAKQSIFQTGNFMPSTQLYRLKKNNVAKK